MMHSGNLKLLSRWFMCLGVRITYLAVETISSTSLIIESVYFSDSEFMCFRAILERLPIISLNSLNSCYVQ